MSSPKAPSEIIRLLHDWQKGSGAAQTELWSILYGEFQDLVQSDSTDRPQGPQAPATSLIQQTSARLLGEEAERIAPPFFILAARALRFALADKAQRQFDENRSQRKISGLNYNLSRGTDPLAHHPQEVVAVHQALIKLAPMHPRHEKIVELLYFAGLSIEETAEVLAIAPRMVVRDWKTVRLWLQSEGHKII